MRVSKVRARAGEPPAMNHSSSRGVHSPLGGACRMIFRTWCVCGVLVSQFSLPKKQAYTRQSHRHIHRQIDRKKEGKGGRESARARDGQIDTRSRASRPDADRHMQLKEHPSGRKLRMLNRASKSRAKPASRFHMRRSPCPSCIRWWHRSSSWALQDTYFVV